MVTQRELALLVTAKDLGASRTLRGVGAEVVRLEGTSRLLGRGLSNLNQNLQRGLVIGAGAAAGALAYAVNAAGDFEEQLRTINTVARLNDQELATLGEGLRKLARETGTGLDDLTTGYYDLVSAGIAASQAQGVLTASNRLAIGGLATTAEGIDLITTALNSYGVSAENQAAEAERFADILAKSIERGKVTAADLAATFAQIGPLAANSGIEIEELAAAYAQLTAKGVPASEAATQMTSALIALMRRTGDLEDLEEATGKSYLAIAGEKGLVVALEELRKDGEAAGEPMIDLLGRIEGLNFLTNTTGANLEDYNEHLREMGDAEGTAAEQMAERQQGLNFQLKRLRANVHDAAIEIGNALLPQLNQLASQGIDWLVDHRDDVKDFAKDLAGGFREAVQWAQSLDWNAIAGAFRTGGEFGKSLLDAFLNAPPWVQQVLIGMFVANKLTGGVVGSIVGELAKGLIRGVLGITAGIVNVTGGVVNGGPGLPGAGGGRGAGRGVPLLGVGGAIGLGLTLGGSDANADTQAQMLAQRLRDGQSLDEADRGITLGAMAEFIRNSDLHVSIKPEDIATIRALVSQLAAGGRSFGGSWGETRNRFDTSIDERRASSTPAPVMLPDTAMSGIADAPPILRNIEQGNLQIHQGIRGLSASERESLSTSRAVLGKVGIIAAKDPTINLNTDVAVTISAAAIDQQIARVRQTVSRTGQRML